jgi:hypothetical protein
MGDFQHYSHSGPFERHFYFVIVMPREPIKEGFILKTDEKFLTSLTSLSSLYYGKRIEHHGPMFMGGKFLMADLLNIKPNPYFQLPFYSASRQNSLSVVTDWRKLKEISDLLAKCSDNVQYTKINKAAIAYAESLRLFVIDKEIAYFRLIQSLECLVDKRDYSDEQLYGHDEQLTFYLSWLVSLEDNKGKKAASYFKNRLYQVKRSVLLLIDELIDDAFFHTKNNSLTPTSLKQGIAAAYDLRSCYIHTGEQFGMWIDPVNGRAGDTEIIPTSFLGLCEDENIAALLRKSLTYLGLEKVVRYVILKFIHKNMYPLRSLFENPCYEDSR